MEYKKKNWLTEWGTIIFLGVLALILIIVGFGKEDAATAWMTVALVIVTLALVIQTKSQADATLKAMHDARDFQESIKITLTSWAHFLDLETEKRKFEYLEQNVPWITPFVIGESTIEGQVIVGPSLSNVNNKRGAQMTHYSLNGIDLSKQIANIFVDPTKFPPGHEKADFFTTAYPENDDLLSEVVTSVEEREGSEMILHYKDPNSGKTYKRILHFSKRKDGNLAGSPIKEHNPPIEIAE